MYEASKAASRRGSEFPYLYGDVIDVGCGPDPINNNQYKYIKSVRPWDMPDGDAQKLSSIQNYTYDCLHSSHCLEHMVDPREALKNWVRVVKQGGFLVVTVPDEEMYEHLLWPSRFNNDHKWSFGMHWSKRLPRSINILEMLKKQDRIEVYKVERIVNGFDPKISTDQTMGNAECCIEFIARVV